MIERKSLKYSNLSRKFSQNVTDYNRQYCSIYLVRLKQMEVLLLSRIQRKWGDKYPIYKLHKLSEQSNETCVVIGTLFKDQKLKPSVLKQLADGAQFSVQPIVANFTDESDTLFIEDEVQRYEVEGELKGNGLVTGVTCALLGKDLGKGKFQVDDYIFADYRPQVDRPIPPDDIFVLFLSGLDFVNQHNFEPNLLLLSEWINDPEIEEVLKIARIIIAGNSIRNQAEIVKPTISMTSRITESSETIDAVKSLDFFLYKLCQVVDVDLMPGENDPSNHILPQKPMHFCMFPHSATYKSLNTVSNPYFCELNNTKILGTSGQPIRDIMRYSNIDSPTEALECCLKWNHLAPTAPDTLGCYPFYENDVFIIEDCPHVLFAGNQKEFESKLVTGEDGQNVCLISIPEFSATFQAVLFNLRNFECTTVSFNVM